MILGVVLVVTPPNLLLDILGTRQTLDIEVTDSGYLFASVIMRVVRGDDLI